MHAWDFATSVEEVMRGLDDLVRTGKVNYVALSNAPAWIASQANTLAALRGWSPFVALQVEYSLIERTGERELLPVCVSVASASSRSFGVRTLDQTGDLLGGIEVNLSAEQLSRLDEASPIELGLPVQPPLRSCGPAGLRRPGTWD